MLMKHNGKSQCPMSGRFTLWGGTKTEPEHHNFCLFCQIKVSTLTLMKDLNIMRLVKIPAQLACDWLGQSELKAVHAKPTEN